MSDPQTIAAPAAEPSSSPPAPSPAGAPALPPSPPARMFPWPFWLALLLAGLALGLGGLIWQRLGATQQEMARRAQDSAAQAAQAGARAAQAEALVQELQARLTVAEVKLSEVALQRSQLDELMLSLSRSRDDTLVQDIEAAIGLAQQQAQLTGSVQPLMSALRAADKRIARAAQPRLNPVQRAIARDIERIQGAVLTDVPALVQRLNELAQQVDQWPLANDALATGAHVARPAAASSPSPGSAGKDGAAPGTSFSWATLWARARSDIMLGLRDLVRVGRIDHPEAALLAPDQGFFLRENLKLQLLNARLGLLARQQASARGDVQAVEALLVRYFNRDTAPVKGALATLARLQTELVPVELPRPEESLAALAAAAGGR